MWEEWSAQPEAVYGGVEEEEEGGDMPARPALEALLRHMATAALQGTAVQPTAPQPPASAEGPTAQQAGSPALAGGGLAGGSGAGAGPGPAPAVAISGAFARELREVLVLVRRRLGGPTRLIDRLCIASCWPQLQATCCQPACGTGSFDQ